MNPPTRIPDKYLLLVKVGVLALTVIAAIWWWNSHNAGQQRIGYDRAMGEVAAAQQALADARREREDEDQGKADKEARNAQDQINDIVRQRDAARADADRLHEQYRQAAERGRQALACPAGTSPSEPGSDPLGVFVGLLERADQRAEEVAGYADRLRVAGLACERLYDKVSVTAPHPAKALQ